MRKAPGVKGMASKLEVHSTVLGGLYCSVELEGTVKGW